MASSFCQHCESNGYAGDSDLAITLAGQVYIITCRICGAVIGVIKDDKLFEEPGAEISS